MKAIIKLLFCILLSWTTMLAQDKENRVLRKFAESPDSKTILRGKANDYIKTELEQHQYYWKQRNIWSMCVPKYIYDLPYPISPIYPIDGEKVMKRIYKKHLSPYFKKLNSQKEQEKGSAIGANLFTDTQGIVQETLLAVFTEDEVDIPAEVCEALDAEILEAGLKVYFGKPDVVKLSKADFYAASRGIDLSEFMNYSKKSEREYYETSNLSRNLSINYHTIHNTERQNMLFRLIQIAYQKLWDTAKLRYFTPEIISRLYVDVEYPEYRDPKKHYAYREGKYAALLLPFDQRTKITKIKDQLDKRAYDVSSAIYQILFNPKHYAELSDLDLALAYLQKLVQAYLSYELIVEARIDPKVKSYLDEQSWFYGDFKQTLAYYAKVKNINLEDLQRTYIEELSIVLNRLNITDRKTIKQKLIQQLQTTD